MYETSRRKHLKDNKLTMLIHKKLDLKFMLIERDRKHLLEFWL